MFITGRIGNFIWVAAHACPQAVSAAAPSGACRTDLKNAGLANVTATYMNMLGFEAPAFYEPSLITTD